jgi:sec-independent protein translocase protein TatC
MAHSEPSRHDEQVDANEQPFLEHVVELRQRILKSVLVVFVIFVPAFFFANDIYRFVAAPLLAQLPGQASMIATEVASPFTVPIKLAFATAVFAAIPFILHQAWAFVSPGLYLHEKRFAMPLLVSSVVLFAVGVAFAYFAVFPVIFQFFASTAPAGVTMMTDINRYLDFVLAMFFAFGFTFEIPVAILLMVWSGITTAERLAASRPYVVVGCFVIGMVLTPPDVVSQSLLAIPMWMLFEVGVLVAKFIGRENVPE